MMSNQNQVLILGGRGRIGSSVALDLLTHTAATVTITGRAGSSVIPIELVPFGDRVRYMPVDLADEDGLVQAIESTDLVVHCAGPFRRRTTQVLELCIDRGVNYTDVSDDRVFTAAALAHRDRATAAGVTAIINTGVFPGISNSMARQGVEQFDSPTEIRISYVVAGSGGAGVTVMRTTFLNIQQPFAAWLDGNWQQVKPYTGREKVEFPAPFGTANVYWFDMPESLTLSQTYPVRTVTTKFGTVPNFYNYLTWLTAHWFPKPLMRQPQFIEALAHISHSMTGVTDLVSGIGVGMRVDVLGEKDGHSARYSATFSHPSAAISTGIGTGSISEYILNGRIKQPGVWPVEQAIETDIFTQMIASRQISIEQHWS
jgi:saccharopine dehydrogenase-like NADP-dependent oxidoreductase